MTEHDATLGVVFDNGQPAPEELAKIWAAAQPLMFPALAAIRNEARALLGGRSCIPDNVLLALLRIEKTAASALPVPTIGDLNGTSPLPPALEATNADSLIATAKRIAWAHWLAAHPHDVSANAEELWCALNYRDHEGYLAAARAVSGGPQSQPDAALVEALKFYANREHMAGDWREWESASGEPDNWLNPLGDPSVMLENGGVARAAIRAHQEASNARAQAKQTIQTEGEG